MPGRCRSRAVRTRCAGHRIAASIRTVSASPQHVGAPGPAPSAGTQLDRLYAAATAAIWASSAPVHTASCLPRYAAAKSGPTCRPAADVQAWKLSGLFQPAVIVRSDGLMVAPAARARDGYVGRMSPPMTPGSWTRCPRQLARPRREVRGGTRAPRRRPARGSLARRPPGARRRTRSTCFQTRWR